MRKLILTAMLAVSAAFTARCETETVGDYTWTYKIVNGGAVISKEWSCAVSPEPTGDLTIPSTLGGLAVTSIGSHAFYFCTGLTSVAIPSSVTSIGQYAFSNCYRLTSVTIPSSVTSIGSYAFFYCYGLTSVMIPSSVANIGPYAFLKCYGLTSFVVDGQNPNYQSANGLLLSKDGTRLIYGIKGDVVIPFGVTNIDEDKFRYFDELTSVTIPSSVTNIGPYAFYECNRLKSVTIPSSVTNIGPYAFCECTCLTSVAIPSSVTSIGPYAFYDCKRLATVCVSSGDADRVAKLIEESGLGVEGLELVEMDDLTTFTVTFCLGEHGTRTGGGALSQVVKKGFSAAVPTVAAETGWSFDEWSGEFRCVMRDMTVVALYSQDQALGDGVYTQTVDGIAWTFRISGRRASVGGEYYYSPAVSSETAGAITIPSELGGRLVTGIAGSAFSDCGGLTSVSIPSSVTGIGPYAFSGCYGLTSVTIPESVTSIDSYAFSGCYGLTSVTIPESVTSIGPYAFSGCFELTSVTIPESVTSIGGGAFDYCSSLGNGVVIIDGCVLTVNGECPNEVVLPMGTCLIADDAFCNCSGLASVTIPEGVTSLGVSAFYRCSGLTSVTIPEGVTSLGAAAFSDCSGLTSVTIPSSVTDIGYYAFDDCTKLSTVYVSPGDADRVLKLIKESNSSVKGLKFVEVGDVKTHTVTFDVGEHGTRTGGGALSQVVTNGFAAASPTVVAETGWTFDGWSGEFGCVTNDMTVVALYSQYQVLEDAVHTRMVDGIAWTFRISDGKASAGGGTYDSPAVSSATAGAISIPSSFGGCPVTSIGEWAFRYCTRLTSVTIPSCVTNVGQHVFSGCRGLTSLSVDADNPTYRSDRGLLLTKDGRTLIAGVNGDVAIPDGVMSIADYAFEGCSGLKSVKIPSSVTNIGAYAFKNCSGLKAVTIPSTVTSIDSTAFYGCDAVCEATLPGWKCGIAFKSVTNLVISSGTTSIDGSAFSGCSGLMSVTIPTSVTSIGASAFSGCSELKSVEIPASVTYLGASSFAGCTQLGTLTFDGYLPNAADGIFGGDQTSVVVHAKQGADAMRYWQGARIRFDVPGSIEESGGTPGGTQTTAVNLTVTNVIVHYVTNSKTSDSVVPDTTAGIVNIVAEIDSSKAVAITEDWAAQYPDFASTFGSDFSKALTMPTGKKDGAGNPMLVWQDYVAGTDPTNEKDVFTASITFDKDTGKPVISYSPELTAAEAAKREYKKYGKVKLTDEWVEISDATAENYNFFKVSVGMKY